MYYGLLAPEDKQQAVYQGLMGLGSGLLQGSAPSSTPKGLLGGIGQGLKGFQQGMQDYAGAMQKNKMAQVQMADLEAKRKRQADMDASRAKLMMTDPLKLSDSSSLPLIMGASDDPVAAYFGFQKANQPNDTRTEAQKHAESMGFQPGTQPYNDYIMDVTKTPPKPDKPDPMFGTGLEGRMYGIYSQGKQHPQYNLAVAHLSQPRTVMTPSGLMTIPAALGPDGSLLAGGGKPQIDNINPNLKEKYDIYENVAATLPNVIEKLNLAKQLSSMIDSGYGTESYLEVRKMAGRLGFEVNDQDIANQELMRTLTTESAVDALASFKGSTTDFEYGKVDLMQSRLGNTQQGNLQILDYRIALANKELKLAQRLTEATETGEVTNSFQYNKLRRQTIKELNEKYPLFPNGLPRKSNGGGTGDGGGVPQLQKMSDEEFEKLLNSQQ